MSLIWFQNKIEMPRERVLPLVERFSRRFGLVQPRVLPSTLDLPQNDETQESEPPSIEEINGELDFIKTSVHIYPRTDRKTGIDYFELPSNSRQLQDLSAETQRALNFNGRNGEVTITFAYDLGVARMISVQRKSKVASFVITTDPARRASFPQERQKKEIPLTPADALLIAKLGRRLARA